MRVGLRVAALIGLLLLGSGCGAQDSSTPTAAQAADDAAGSVEIKGFAFVPAELEVASGTDLRVVNADDAAHTLTADDGSFDSGTIDGGGQGAVVVKGKGSVPYHCTIHDYMKATLILT